MNITLIRSHSEGGATLGKLFCDGAWKCDTLEDEIREVEGQPVSEWKIPGKTAIPAGRYKVTLEYSGKFGADTMTLNDVPGYTYVRMHPGNDAEDTDGCILLGLRGGMASLIGGSSRPAVELVKSLVKQAIARDEEVWIDINNPMVPT